MAGASRAEPPKVFHEKNGDGGNVQRNGQVHRSRIPADEHVTALDQRGQMLDRIRRDQDGIGVRLRTKQANHALLVRPPEHHDPHTELRPQTIRQGRKALHQPAFSTASSEMHAHHKLVLADAPVREDLERPTTIHFGDRDSHRRLDDLIHQIPEQIQVNVRLVPHLLRARHAQVQEQIAVLPVVSHAERRMGGMREIAVRERERVHGTGVYGQIEGPLSQTVQEPKKPDGMRKHVSVPEHNQFVQVRTFRQQLRKTLPHEKGHMPLRERGPDRSEKRRNQHQVADPMIQTNNQNFVHPIPIEIGFLQLLRSKEKPQRPDPKPLCPLLYTLGPGHGPFLPFPP